jgi:hypothetical protein
MMQFDLRFAKLKIFVNRANEGQSEKVHDKSNVEKCISFVMYNYVVYYARHFEISN